MQALLLQVVITQGSKTYSSKGVLSRHRFGATSLNPQLRLPVMVTTPQGRGQTPNTSLIPTASTRSTLQQDIQNVFELCKCWTQSLPLWKVLNNSKSLQEATSKVLRETDLLVQQICTCPSVKMKLIPAQGIILHPPHWFSMLFWTFVWVEAWGLSGRKLGSREGEVLQEEEMKCHSSQHNA